MDSARIDQFVCTMLSECNEAKDSDNLAIRQATGKPEGTYLSCSDIIEYIINTKDASVYLSGLRILTLMMFGGNGTEIPEEMAVKIVGKLINQGFQKGLLS